MARFGNKAAITALTSGLAGDGSETTLNVGSTEGWPTPATGEVAKGAVGPDSSNKTVFSYTGKTATTLTGVVQGIDGTSAFAHGSGVAVEHIISSQDMELALAERVFTMGKAGTIAATETDAADFLLVVPFPCTLKRLKTSRKTAVNASVVQIRRSTDSGASYSNAFGSATFASGTALVATADPADLNVNEGDILNFSVATGGGTNLLVEVTAVPR